MPWKITYWKSSSGDYPVYDFIQNLEVTTQAKIYNTFELLEEFGVALGPPHLKKISGTPLWEIRILGMDSIRIFYITIKEQTFLLIHGFKKKSQKTPQKEIKTALKRIL